ncbi:hypothetical protein D0T85_07565 [Bacteroides sp. 519]|nr:hypothetical protein [Bacteroides sp. 519]
MIDFYNILLILLVYTAILLLGIFYVYPFLKKLFRRKISISIHIGTKEKDVKKKVVQPQKQEELPSVLGKSKFVLRQPLPNATARLETENPKEKEDTFAPETKKSADENINLETGEGVEVEEENEEVSDVDLNDEREELVTGNVSEEASGIDFNKLGATTKVISNPEGSSRVDEEMAGKVLSENKYTELVKSMQDARPDYAKRITDLIDRHEQKLAEAQNQKAGASRRKQKLYESDDFKNFNIEEIS